MTKSMAQQHREKALRVLREAGERPVSVAELRERGIPNPASVIYELELAGFAIDRVHRRGRLLGVRLLEHGEEPEAPKRPRRFGR
jgi:biotin operon repressor